MGVVHLTAANGYICLGERGGGLRILKLECSPSFVIPTSRDSCWEGQLRALKRLTKHLCNYVRAYMHVQVHECTNVKMYECTNVRFYDGPWPSSPLARPLQSH